MRSNVIGRIRNTKLPLSHGLLPVYEAIVNSIDAIEELKQNGGAIQLRVSRDPEQLEMDVHGNAIANITAFEIIDNGIGFTERNYQSFETLDNRTKAATGGKGIGRLLWLKAFEVALIDSTYEEDGDWYRRRFRFAATEEGIEEHVLEPLQDRANRETRITLSGFRSAYQAAVRKSLPLIARHIVDHTLEFFVLGRAPRLVLQDVAAGEELDLHHVFDQEYQPESAERSFEVPPHSFRMMDVLLRAESTGPGHKLHFCAHNRVVLSIPLTDTDIPHLEKTVKSAGGEERVYAAYIGGELLNDRVDQERTDFLIDREGHLEFSGGVKWNEIVDAAVASATGFLRPMTEEARERSRQRIEEFVRTKAPKYRLLLKRRPTALERISSDIPDARLDLELHKLMTEWRHELRRETSEQLEREDQDEPKDLAELRARRGELLSKLQDILKADLVEYVVQRRAVLEFLKKLLGRLESGVFPEEDAIHQVFFPLRKSSDDVDYDDHNLWILDERLAYHRYLASDIPLKSQEGPIESESSNRPDLLIYNRSMAFSEHMLPVSSAVVVEFKRPERDDYDDRKSPIGQVIRYVSDIREGKARRDDGSTITVSNNLPFYCYVVATLTPRLKQDAVERGFTIAPDAQGYFTYNPNYRAYIEVSSFHKVLDDAVRRNRVFFDKLGIPFY